MRSITFALLLLLAAVPAASAQEIAGYTNLSFDPGHGTQIEYISSEGGAYLWYPGNSIILPGRWKLEDGRMCFSYGPNTYNPVTGTRGGAWECAPLDFYFRPITERAKGDILALEGRHAVPFELGREPTSLAEMVEKVGR
jgi:hypothetical protein